MVWLSNYLKGCLHHPPFAPCSSITVDTEVHKDLHPLNLMSIALWMELVYYYFHGLSLVDQYTDKLKISIVQSIQFRKNIVFLLFLNQFPEKPRCLAQSRHETLLGEQVSHTL